MPMARSYQSTRGAWSILDATISSRLSTPRPVVPRLPSCRSPPPRFAYSRRLASSLAESGPRIAQPSIWKSIIPKFLRGGSRPSSSPTPSNKPPQPKEWNPFVVYIAIFILIGSNAINLIGIRNDLLSFSQKTDRQITLLKEVIRKVQNGEKVDIDAALGAGDPEQEKDWEEALKEIESSDTLYNKELRKREKKASQRQDSLKHPAEAPTAKASSNETSKKSTGFY